MSSKEIPGVSSDVLQAIDSIAPQKNLSFIQRFFSRLDRSVYKDEEEFLENPALPMEKRVDLVARLNGLNRRSGYHTAFLMELTKLVKSIPAHLKADRPLRILDIGVGGGGLLERIHSWSLKQGIPVELYGIDVDKDFLEKTAAHLKEKNVPAKLILGSGSDLSPLEDESIDIVVSSYVVHHVRTLKSLTGFFEEILRVSRCGWLIVDMERRFWGPPFAWFSGYLFGGSTTLVWDGVKSMRRAYTSQEINGVLRNAVRGFGAGDMVCLPHALFPYWIVKGVKTPLPHPQILQPSVRNKIPSQRGRTQ